MRANKKICVVIAALTVCLTVFASCGDENSDKKTNDANVNVTAKADENVDVVAVADSLKNDITFKDTLTELSTEMIQRLFNLAEGTDYKAGKVYVGSGGATAEEVACFEANDENGAAKIKETLENRIESQKTAFENYQPQEMDKLNSPVLVTKGNCVFMCISDDNAKAKEIIG